MKYLIDNQLPPALVQHLATHALAATHVADVGLAQSPIRSCGGLPLLTTTQLFARMRISFTCLPPTPPDLRLYGCGLATVEMRRYSRHSTGCFHSFSLRLGPVTRLWKYDNCSRGTQLFQHSRGTDSRFAGPNSHCLRRSCRQE